MLTKLVRRRNDFVFARPRSGELLLVIGPESAELVQVLTARNLESSYQVSMARNLESPYHVLTVRNLATLHVIGPESIQHGRFIWPLDQAPRAATC